MNPMALAQDVLGSLHSGGDKCRTGVIEIQHDVPALAPELRRFDLETVDGPRIARNEGESELRRGE